MMLAAILSLPARALKRESSRRVLLLVAAAVASIWPTWPPLLGTWNTTADYGHGPLVAVVAIAWMFYAATKVDEGVRPAGWQAYALLGGALCCWLVAFKANVDIGMQLLAPVILWLAVAAGSGWRNAIKMALPIFYLYFAIPVWDLIVPLLQALTVAVSRGVLGLLGVPLRIDGVLVTIPEGSFIVEEGCSGKRYLIVALALASVYAAMASLGRRQTLKYLAVSASAALVANWVRVNIVIYAGHVTNMTHYFVAREHVSLGWLIFILLIVALLIIGRRFHAPARPPVPVAVAAANAPHRAAVLATLAALCFPALAMGYARLSESRPGTLLAVAAEVPGWRGPLAGSEEWQPHFSGATTESRKAFESHDGLRVETYAASYANQRRGAELVQFSNRMLGQRWAGLSSTTSVRSQLGGEALTVSTVKGRAPSGTFWLIDYYYVVDGVRTSREWASQLVFGLRSWTHSAESSVIAAAVPCAQLACERAERTLAAFWEAHGKAPGGALGGRR
jgi:EpsI family protein